MIYTCKSKAEAKVHLCPHFNSKSRTKDIGTSIKERVIRARYRYTIALYPLPAKDFAAIYKIIHVTYSNFSLIAHILQFACMRAVRGLYLKIISIIGSSILHV